MRYKTGLQQGQADRTTASLVQLVAGTSIALGLIELLAPRKVTRTLGMHGLGPLVQIYGLREIAKGIGLLTSKDPVPWMKARLAGDALDAATLLPFLSRSNRRRENAALALLSVVAITALDEFCAKRLHHSTAEPLPPPRDYSDRSGFPGGVGAARERARSG